MTTTYYCKNIQLCAIGPNGLVNIFLQVGSDALFERAICTRFRQEILFVLIRVQTSFEDESAVSIGLSTLVADPSRNMAYNLPAELFTELGIGILIFALRFYARWRTAGPENFGYDDVFAGIAVVCWSFSLIRLNGALLTEICLHRFSGSSKQPFYTHAV